MFCDDRDAGLDVTTAALAAIDKFGVSEAFEFPHMIADLSIDEAGTRWALEQVSTLGDTNSAFHFLSWVCERSPVGLLREKLPEIELAVTGKFEQFPRLTTSARQRLEFHALPAQKCLLRLHEILALCGEQDEFPHNLINEARLLCRRLVEAGDALRELEQLTRDWLEFDLSGDISPRHWYSGMAIELAGMLRLESTIPRLIEHFSYDWDWWSEAIQKSVGAMRSLETLELCAGIYPSLDWHGRLYLAEVFESPRIPEIEPRLSSLLKNEPDDDLRVDLADALAVLGTHSSQSIARAVYRECPDDPERFFIAETLYYQFVIQGVDDPDLKRWRTKMERFRRMHTSNLSRFSAVESAPSIPKDVIPVKFSAGRNDPCPCGSGKKFKKCCLEP